MSLKVLRLIDPRNAIGLFAVAVLVLTTGLYVVFDYYLDSVGKEIASSWLQSEAVEIQEGNLLSSISKNQRVLMSSQVIKGIKLVDSRTGTALIEFGEDYESAFPTSLALGTLESHAQGFLYRRLFYRLPSQGDLVVSFQTHSDFLTRAFLATVATFVALLIFLFVNIRRIESKRIAAETRNQILLGEVAARVAHDIRSPLNTLTAVLETIDDLPTSSRKLLQSAILRIREIGLGVAEHSKLAMSENSSLRSQTRDHSTESECILIAPLVAEILEEKRIQYRDRAEDLELHIATDVRTKFCRVDEIEFRRSLSNLLDNAFEASKVGSKISVQVSLRSAQLCVAISDQGVGISKKDLQRIGEKGFTRNKASGTGLGVHYAKRAVASWNGKLDFESSIGCGATVTISLPIAGSPDWYVQQLDLKGYPTIVIVDDDPTIHAVWKDRLDREKCSADVEHFFDAEAASSWAVQNRELARNCLLLTDFNLNSKNGSGLTVLDRFGLKHPAAVMVTNASNNRELQRRCSQLGVKMLPKTLIDAKFN